MTSKMQTPQSIELHYILPALRRKLALGLKMSGMGQKQIAEKLSVTGAAVSQYINDKRACGVCFNKKIDSEINESVKRIKEGSFLLYETQGLLKLVKQEKVTCKVCTEEGNVPKGCEVCFECGHI